MGRFQESLLCANLYALLYVCSTQAPPLQWNLMRAIALECLCILKCTCMYMMHVVLMSRGATGTSHSPLAAEEDAVCIHVPCAYICAGPCVPAHV